MAPDKIGEFTGHLARLLEESVGEHGEGEITGAMTFLGGSLPIRVTIRRNADVVTEGEE